MVNALQALAQRDDTSGRHVAVGAINSLSRSSHVRSDLLRGDVLKTLSLVLQQVLRRSLSLSLFSFSSPSPHAQKQTLRHTNLHTHRRESRSSTRRQR